MPVAKHDENSRPTIICASSTNGTTIVPITANPSTHGLSIDDNTTGSDNGNNNGAAMLDENSVPVWIAESSANNGAIVEIYGDVATGKVLIDSV